MDADLEVLPAVLVDVRATDDRVPVLLGRERIGPRTFASVRVSVSTIFFVDWSMIS